MNDTVVGAIIGAAATIAGGLLVLVAGWFMRRARRKIFARALAEEIDINRGFLKGLLNNFPLQADGSVLNASQFLAELAGQQTTDHLFVSLLPNLDVLPADVIAGLTNAHTRLKSVIGQAESLPRRSVVHKAKADTQQIRKAVQAVADDFRKAHDRLAGVGNAPTFGVSIPGLLRIVRRIRGDNSGQLKLA